MTMSAGHMPQPVLELQVLRGRDLVPKDSNGLSDPYVLVKYGSKTMFRSRVVKKSLNPEWDECVTLSAPSADDVILVVRRMNLVDVAYMEQVN